MPFIEPNLTVDDPGEAGDNTTALNEALTAYVSTGGILLLPKGVIYANQVTLTEAHRGLVIQGSGTETKLRNVGGGYLLTHQTNNFGYVDVATYTAPTYEVTVASSVAEHFEVDDVVWLFESITTNMRTPFQQRFTVLDKLENGGITLILSGVVTQGGLALKWTKGGRVASINVDRRSVTIQLSQAA